MRVINACWGLGRGPAAAVVAYAGLTAAVPITACATLVGGIFCILAFTSCAVHTRIMLSVAGVTAVVPLAELQVTGRT
jgi:glucose uptake protein GlcU